MKNFLNKSISRFLTICLMAFLMMIAGSQHLYATHAAGSDIKYRCLGGLQYEVEVTFYRDCGGVDEPDNITVNYKSTIANVNLNATATKISGTGAEITVPCTTAATTCNGGSGTGIRKFVYRATITLPSAQTDWVFSYSVCCRNCAITTISNPCGSNSVLYVEAKLNNFLASCNSSPTFSNIPIAFVCIGQPFNYNHGVLDPDGDSLVYSLITPKISSSANVSFISPSTAAAPMASSTPFSMNATTGDISFTPSQVQIGIMAILVKEYRNGQLIGSVIRDMQVYTTACNNNLPTLSGINGTTSYSKTVCPGQQVCFSVNSADADASQTVSLSTNSGIPNATYTISSGTRPTLNFCWTPTVNDIDLNPKTFTVTVRDNACPSNGIQTYSFNIFVPSPYFNVTNTNITCNGATTATATAAPVYSGTYNYNWNTTPATTTATASNLGAGTYSVTVTDPASGCSATKSVTVTQPSGMTLTSTKTDPSCAGKCNGNIDLTVSGGSAPYTYVWSSGQTTQDLSNLCPGNYTVTVKDANNCTKPLSFTLANINTLTSAATAASVACFGVNSGGITTTISGGTSPYTYAWSNGSNSQNLSNALAGTFTVTITDNIGCTSTASAQITQPAAALALSLSKINVKCFGDLTGSVTASVSGGTGPYSYSWNNGSTATALVNIAAGNYTLTVTDSRGCTASATVSVTQPTAPLSFTQSQTNILCFGNNTGSASVSVSGGTGTCTYLWSTGATVSAINNLVSGSFSVTVTDANSCTVNTSFTIVQPLAALTATINATTVNCFGGNNAGITTIISGGTSPCTYNWSNGSTTQNLVTLTAGNYSVTITDANGCTANKNTTVTQPSAALAASLTKSNVLCNGANTGTVNLNVTGGTAPCSYLWSNGSILPNLISLISGTYSVTVTDARGCTANANITIGQPAAALSLTANKTDVRCFGNSTGAAGVSPSGGTGPFTYQWSNGATTSGISNLTAATYVVTVKDANNCTASTAVVISQPSQALASTATTVNVKCYADNTGGVLINVTGGTIPYTYLWSNGNGSSSNSNLIAGNYTVTVTDANGCSLSRSSTVTQPSGALQVSATETNVKCFGLSTGASTLTVSGGTSPYSYAWSNGTTAKDLGSVAAGIFTVTVTDANNCTVTNTSVITQPAAALSMTSASTNINCYNVPDGTVTTTVNGGTQPYRYNWNNGATTADVQNLASGSYTVTVTDANNCSVTNIKTLTQPSAAISLSATHVDVTCNGLPVGSVNLTPTGGTTPYTYSWNIGSAQQDVTNLTAGTYTVTVTDANGCTKNLSETISQPAGALNASAVIGNVSCYGLNNGNIDLSATAGTAPYAYHWSNGSTNQDLSNLGAGTYTVTVSDNNNCAIQFTVFVTQPSAALSASLTPSPALCFGDKTGSIDLTINGGTTPYSVNWSNGITTEDLELLYAGNYSVSITDAKGCTTSGLTSVSQPAQALSVIPAIKNLNCHDVDDGGIDLTVSGGTGPYDYTWSTGSTTQDITGLSTGSYTVTVSDNNKCSFTATYSITYAASTLAATASVSQVKCFADSTGFINLNVTGGSVPYAFNWNNGSISEDLNNIPSGTYTVSVTDANGCTTSFSTSVNQPAAPVSTTSSINPVLCYGNLSGAIDVSTIGGTLPYHFNWNNNIVSEDLLGLAAGNYTLTITDANNCVLKQTFAVEQPSAPIAVNFQLTNPGCYGDSSGAVVTTISGGTAAYTVLWSNQAITNDLSNLTSGSYQIKVTDANGCELTKTATLTQPQFPLEVQNQITNVDCNANLSGSVNLVTTGGTTPYTFNWSNGATTQSVTGLTAGIYQYTVTDAHNCIFAGSVEVTQPQNALSLDGTVSDVKCFANSTGSIDITTTGGTLPYNYNWSNSATTDDVIHLATGNYTVTVTDANGCSAQQSFAVQQPAAALAVTSNITNAGCFASGTGGIQTTVTGGTAAYHYSWNNGDTLPNLSLLNAGTYSVLVTDESGCTAAASYTVSQPTATLSATSSLTAASCNGNNNGAINLTAAGGTTPYTYAWSNGFAGADPNGLTAGTYTVTITDANQCTLQYSATVQQPAAALDITYLVQDVKCFGNHSGTISSLVTGGTGNYSYNWSNGSHSANINNLTAGIYTLTVTDANSCSMTLPVSISQPVASLQLNVVSSDIKCRDDSTGSIDLSVTGGMGNYSYQWHTGDTTQDLNHLLPGTYAVVVTDGNGCNASTSATITQPTASIQLSTSVTNVSCKGMDNANISINVSGGTPNYTFNWSNGATTQQLNTVTAGNYSITVTDANGCKALYTTTISEPSSTLISTDRVVDANCLSADKGAIYIVPSGGTAPYTYLWTDGGIVQNRLNEVPGTYTVKIMDMQGCELNRSYTIADSTHLDVKTLGDATICMGDKVTLTTDPVGTDVTLQWSYNGVPLNGATTNSFITPVAGTYSLTAVTPCGTYTSNTIEVAVRALNTVSVNNNVIVCPGESIQLTAGGGVDYSWEPKEGLNYTNVSNPIATPKKSMLYVVTVKDQYGCKATANVAVTLACDTLDIPNGFSPNDDGTNDYFVIDRIDQYPGNSIFIYNRWGNLIYKAKDYDNKWDGRSNVGGVMFGQRLPNGTYYFILDLNNNEKPITNFVVIRK